MKLWSRLGKAAFRARVYGRYVRAVEDDTPAWSDRRKNMSPHFEFALGEIREVLRSRGLDESRALEVMDALTRAWPGGVARYNLWYVCQGAARRGLIRLDSNEVRARGTLLDETSRHRQEILDAGGDVALATYRTLGGRD